MLKKKTWQNGFKKNSRYCSKVWKEQARKKRFTYFRAARNKCFYFKEFRWFSSDQFWIEEQTQLGLLGNHSGVLSQRSCTEISYCYHFYPKEGIVLNAKDPTCVCYQQAAVHQPSSSSKIPGHCLVPLLLARLASCWGSMGAGAALAAGFALQPHPLL